MEEFKLPNGQMMFHLHQGECLFLYREIFLRRCYLSDGITLDASSEGVVFDVGANIGMATYFFHEHSPKLKIHAVEPSPRTFEVLAANVNRMGIDAVLHRCAMAASAGTATITHYPSKSSMSGLYASPAADRDTTKIYMENEGMDPEDVEFVLADAFASETFEVELKTLSSVIDEYAIDRIELLKVDVEKAELDVLRGIRQEHWPMIRQLVAEVHDIDHRVDTIAKLCRDHGLKVSVKQDQKLEGTELYSLTALR